MCNTTHTHTDTDTQTLTCTSRSLSLSLSFSCSSQGGAVEQHVVIFQKHETRTNAGDGGNIASCAAHHVDHACKSLVLPSPPHPPNFNVARVERSGCRTADILPVNIEIRGKGGKA